MACMQCLTAILFLHYVLAGEEPLTASECRNQRDAIKTELDLLKKVLNSVFTNTQQSTSKNIVDRPSNDIELPWLRMLDEAKTINLEKEIENLKLRQQRYGTGLASLSHRVHVVKSQQNLMTKQSLLEARQNLMMTHSRDQASELNDLQKQVAEQEKLLNKCEAALTSLTSAQVDIAQQLAEQKEVSWNQTSEQDAFRVSQTKIRDKQILVLKAMTDQTRLIKACNMKVDEYKADCMENINNRTSVMQQRINTFSRKQQNQSLLIKQQETFLNRLSEERTAQDHKTSTHLKYLSRVYKQLNTDLNNLDVAHNSLEQDFSDHTQQAKETGDFLKFQQQGLQMQQVILKTELSDLESYLNLTYAMLMNETKTKGKDCADLYNNGFRQSGVYAIQPKDGFSNMDVYCDMVTNGGGWTVFQRRQDGSVDFYRGWSDYKAGFGYLNGEFWLGNDNINRLTHQDAYKLRVELEDFSNNAVYAAYEDFSIGSEREKYKLAISNYSGNAGDSLSYQNGQPFTTKDRDNDAHFANCAVDYKGAWWYNACHYSNLNGLYHHGNHKSRGERVIWYYYKGLYSMKRTSMKIRPVRFKSSN